LIKVLTGVKKGTLEPTPQGIWSDNDISILDPEYVELKRGYQKYFVIGEGIENEVSIDDFPLNYEPLTLENFTAENTIIKEKPQVTLEKLEALTIAKIKEFVRAGSDALQSAVNLKDKKSGMINDILFFFNGEIQS